MGGVAAAEDGGGGGGGAVGFVDGGLEGVEGGLGGGLGGVVAGDGDVDDGAGGDVGREEDGGEFDLWGWWFSLISGSVVVVLRTSLLSSVRRTATPASTLPTVREMSMMV